MTKYLVDVYVPAIGKHFDAYLPAGKMIGEATNLLIKIVESLSSGNYSGSASSMLLNADNGESYDQNINVYDAGIRNSARLILI